MIDTKKLFAATPKSSSELQEQTTQQPASATTDQVKKADEPVLATVQKHSFVVKAQAFAEERPILALSIIFFIVLLLAVGLATAVAWTQRPQTEKTAKTEPTIIVATPEPSDPDEEVENSPTPTPAVTPTPKTSPKPTPTPTPTPTPQPLPNLSFSTGQELTVRPIIKAHSNTIQEGDVVNTPDGKSFYYQYAPLGGPQSAAIKQGDEVTFMATVRNTGAAAAAANTLVGTITFADGVSISRDFSVPALAVGASESYNFSHELLVQKHGTVKLTWKLDSKSQVAESNELDNEKITNITIANDVTKPFIHLYNAALTQTDSGVCFNFKNMHTRDDLDALEGSEPSTRTELRFKTSVSNSFTGWIKYSQLNSQVGECVNPTVGQTYSLTVEVRDQSGNTDSVVKSLIAQ